MRCTYSNKILYCCLTQLHLSDFNIPEPPANVRITEVTKNSVSLAWQRPPFDGGSKITGYSVERREAPSGRWVKANFTNIIDLGFTVSGLTQDESYEFRVYTKNAVGSVSNPSLIAGPVTCVDACGEFFIIICGYVYCLILLHVFRHYLYYYLLCHTGAPAIDLPPEYLDVVQYKAGASVKLRVGIIAKPLPTIEWLKDGKELVASSTVSVESTTDSSAVLIKDATRLDTGSYEVKIKNVLGSASATIRIEILGIQKFLPYISVSAEIIFLMQTSIIYLFGVHAFFPIFTSS